MSRIGFLLVTHSKPDQITRLVTRLNTMFDSPPIVIHHDFGKCPLPADFLADYANSNISFVRPHLNTGWGRFSVVEAIVQAATQMYQHPDPPEWCALLSGACYPTKPAAQILADLTTGGFDAYQNGRKVSAGNLDSDWHRVRYRRYCVKRIKVPFVTRRVPLPSALGRHLLPFSDSFPCYAGGHWFTINRRAAEYLIEFQKTSQNAALAKFYRDVAFADESYLQTVLYNAPGLHLQSDNLRYIDWSAEWVKATGHPKSLTLSDLEKIQASPAHFARKIDDAPDLLDALDRIIDDGDDGGDPLAVPAASASQAH